jgi:hypothetical protein
MKRLADLTGQTGLAVDPHLLLDLVIPVHDGIQAQGDLLVIPHAELGGRVTAGDAAAWREVPPDGVELLRGAAGGNPHTLVADPDSCLWTPDVDDADGLAIALIDAMAPVYLMHREHGGTGIAPGLYVVRRQRELVPPVTHRPSIYGPDQYHAMPMERMRPQPQRPTVRLVAD